MSPLALTETQGPNGPAFLFGPDGEDLRVSATDSKVLIALEPDVSQATTTFSSLGGVLRRRTQNVRMRTRTQQRTEFNLTRRSSKENSQRTEFNPTRRSSKENSKRTEGTRSHSHRFRILFSARVPTVRISEFREVKLKGTARMRAFVGRRLAKTNASP
jgi:hypothetical protein